MAWSAVTNIGTGTGSGATIAIVAPVVPTKALIIVLIQDLAALGTGSVADSAGNVYVKAPWGLNARSLFYCVDCKPLTAGQTITYTKQDAVADGFVTICYVTNSSGTPIYDPSVFTNTAFAATATPSGTSNVPRDGNELFIGDIVNDTSATFTQDAVNGWSSPPNTTGVFNTRNLSGGAKVVSGRTAQTFAPTLSVAANGGIIIFAFGTASADWIPRLSEPVRRRPPLPQGAIPHFTIGVNYVEFHFAITETSDIASFSFATYPPKNLAQVTITEIEANTAQTIIKEIRYDSEYS